MIGPDEIDFLHNEFSKYERRIEQYFKDGSDIDFIDIFRELDQAVNKPDYTRSVMRARHHGFMRRLNGLGETAAARRYDEWAMREFGLNANT